MMLTGEMMSHKPQQQDSLRIGFVSTRFAGTDGVSLEVEKWVTVLEGMGHTCYYFAGVCDKPADRSLVIEEAFFRHPLIDELHKSAFINQPRPPSLTEKFTEIAATLKEGIYQFVTQFDLQLLIIENALAIPVHIPLGIAITEFLEETRFPTIAHHHDFAWERQRFTNNCVNDFISMAFPPVTPGLQHVVINSIAASEVSRRKGISAWVIPNVMDFHTPPSPPDEYSSDIRAKLGLEQDEFFILQPTRVIQRKGIENAIELVRRLDVKARLVISHAAGDEGIEYERRVREFARLLGVPVRFVARMISTERGLTDDGRKKYTLQDAYQHADLVTYPSTIEGFGNAFLEALYFKVPIVVNNYAIFEVDIMPKGFEVINFDGFITEKTLQWTRDVLTDPELAHRMVEKNFELGKRYYSYPVLQRTLRTILSHLFGESNHSIFDPSKLPGNGS
jgi:mannosylglucosylglycerate synthase